MKVLQVGDVANVARTLTAGLRAEGMDARLVIMPKPGYQEAPEDGIDIIRTPFRALTHSLLVGRLFGRYRKREIFHAHALYNIPLMLLGKLIISHFHGDDLLEVASGDTLLGHLLRKAMHKTRRILVSTPDLLECVAGFGIPEEKVTFLPNPIDVDHFSPRDGMEPLGEDNTVKLFHPTRFQTKKHNERLLYAYRELQDKYPISLYLIKDTRTSPTYGKMVALIKKLGLKRVYFLPPLPHKQMISYYNAADIVLDQFDRPIMCLVSLEAMACGKPVISAFPQDEKNYSQKPPVMKGFTVEQIMESISFLVENRDKWAEIGSKGREWVIQHHSTPRTISQLIGIYEELAG